MNGELIGGSDIVSDMFESGELNLVLGLPSEPTAPRLSFSNAALTLIGEALDQEPTATLHLQIDARWETRFRLGPPSAQAIRVDVAGMPVFMDPSTAQRADGLHIDVADTLQGRALRTENPNAPPPVKAMSVTELKRRLDAGEELWRLDARDATERRLARIAAAVPLDDEQHINGLPKDAPLMLHCHTGPRSRGGAEHFRLLGFQDVYNLDRGIEAWSIEIDPTVPWY